MSYYSGTSESPEISQGSDAEGQHDEPVVTATTATVTSSSSSGVSAIVYFGLCWIVLLSLIVALVCVLVECRCRRNQKLQQEQQQKQSSPATHDIEVAEHDSSCFVSLLGH
jgi:flagellar biosynthesis/type III secretory pathway M-ring protein FliF/YscJ